MDGMGLKGDIMYEWVTDKKFIKETYSTCADIVNQLVQRLNKEGINSYFFDVGSKRRNMITRNGKAPIDFDFNLFIENGMRYNCKELKEYIMNIFNEILKNKKWRASKDSTSVITTGPKNPGKIPYSIDVCIITSDVWGNYQRLIHEKHEDNRYDKYYWNQSPSAKGIDEKEEFLKPDHWIEVRERYLEKRNEYLCQQDNFHPAFVCYIEALNEIYNKYHRFGW